LRESRGAKPDAPDIEKDGEAGAPAPTPKLAIASDDTQNIFHLRRLKSLPPTYESNRLAIEEIWNNVSPWPIQEVALTSAEELQSQPILSLSTPEALHQLLFTRNPGHSPEMTHVEACVPSFRVKSSPLGDEKERQRILVMACCSNIRDKRLKIGLMLEYCYKYGILEQQVNKKSEVYLHQICLLVEGWVLLNRVSEIYWIFDGEFFGFYGDNLKTILTKRMSVEEILGIELVDLLRILHMLNPVPASFESSPGPTLRVDDLNILSLMTFGKLSITWTSILENHLCLDLESMTLSIAWSLLPTGSSTTMRKLQTS
jgi:hypothetical protein